VSPADRAAEILRAGAHGRVERGHAVGPLTSYGLGGDAAVFLEAEGDQDLIALARALEETGLPLLMLGRGSNMLVSDRGFSGVAVRLGAGFRWTRVEGSRIEAGAGVPLPSVAVLSGQQSLAGLEFAVAIPASVGGAVRMNAGAHGHSVGEVLHEVDVFRIEAAARERIPAGRLGFSYRSTDLPADAVVVGAGFALTPGDESEIKDKLREARDWRRANQPLNLPNAGSVFKNPPGDAAGRIIEQVCGKGLRVGGAQISEIHANFIVASAGARADDVYTLIRRIQRRVKDETGIELEPEVRLVGEFEEVEDGAPAR
jgi:UDP-N-acetylmuramate dehydrogenase